MPFHRFVFPLSTLAAIYAGLNELDLFAHQCESGTKALRRPRICKVVRQSSNACAADLRGMQISRLGDSIMAQQGLFTLPANTNFGVTAFANSSANQTIDVLVDNEVRATFTGNGTDNKLLGSKVINSGKGSVQVKVSANGKASDLVSNQTILTNKLNFALVGSEDGTDGDYNDGIAVLNWPLG
jgi:hypothetical protein